MKMNIPLLFKCSCVRIQMNATSSSHCGWISLLFCCPSAKQQSGFLQLCTLIATLCQLLHNSVLQAILFFTRGYAWQVSRRSCHHGQRGYCGCGCTVGTSVWEGAALKEFGGGEWRENFWMPHRSFEKMMARTMNPQVETVRALLQQQGCVLQNCCKSSIFRLHSWNMSNIGMYHTDESKNAKFWYAVHMTWT